MLLLAAHLAGVSRAADQAGKLPDEKRAKIEAAISTFMASSKAPGISVAAVQGGEFVCSAGFGMADLENPVPASSGTLYRLGSISKSITATAAMALWERGKLDLDCPCRRTARLSRRSPGPLPPANCWDILAESATITSRNSPIPSLSPTRKWATHATSKTESKAG